ncbi:hypothetical protein C8J57DRAFT_1255344 [Mycena rebaudengoi]|nr:hypothetical protein C8J57DRAFT_1255344 [Mycena rebaudengoi]
MTVTSIKALSGRQRTELAQSTNTEMEERISGFDAEQQHIWNRLRDVAQDVPDNDWVEESLFMRAMNGETEVEMSHEGGEYSEALQEQLRKEVAEISKKKRWDGRRRNDALVKRVLGFNGQLTAMTDEYMKWEQTQGEFGTMDGPAKGDH